MTITAGSNKVPPLHRRSVAALLACHNRRDLTLRALRSLAAANDVFNLTVVLFDDASTDDTAEAVRSEFPESVIVSGDGNAFWNGGMYRAWCRALELDVDAYLWLNDDVELDEDALARLGDTWLQLEAMRSGPAFVLVGATRNTRGALTYGGMRCKTSPIAFRLERVPETTALEPIDTLNGNIVLVSAAVVKRIGILDPAYFHMYGDIDYGLRASRSGIPVLQLPSTLGKCEANPSINLATLSLYARWHHILRSPRGTRPKSWWRLVSRFSGIWAPLHFISPYRKLFYPAAWLRR